MSDLFQDKAQDWDSLPIPAQISKGVSAAIQAHVTLDHSLRVMDFGAGTGLICAQIAPSVKELLAVDISEAMLTQLAAKPALKDKVTTICQDITRTPLAERVDLIVSAMAMHHVEDTEGLFKSFYEHLNSGGRLALADLDHEDGDFHPPGAEGVYHSGFEREALAQIARDAGFVELDFVTALEVDKEGKRYPIFMMTGRKAS